VCQDDCLAGSASITWHIACRDDWRQPAIRQQGVIIMSDRDDPLFALVAGITRDEAQRLASDIVGRIALGPGAPAAPQPPVTRAATPAQPHVISLTCALHDVGRPALERCGRTADGWICTRSIGHVGPHVATIEPHLTQAAICAAWED
jgi:hypothetical protein